MTLMLWRTSTPSSLMPLRPQVCAIYKLQSNCSASFCTACVKLGFDKCHYSSLCVVFPLVYLQVSTAATPRSCLGFTTGLQEFRLLYIQHYIVSLTANCFHTQYFMHVDFAIVHIWYSMSIVLYCYNELQFAIKLPGKQSTH